MTKTLVKIDPVKHFEKIVQNVRFVSLEVFNDIETVNVMMKNGNIYMYQFTGADTKKALPLFFYCDLMQKHYNKDTKKYKIETPLINSVTVKKFEEYQEEVRDVNRLPFLNFIDQTWDIMIRLSFGTEIHARYSRKDLQETRYAEFKQLLKKNSRTKNIKQKTGERI